MASEPFQVGIAKWRLRGDPLPEVVATYHFGEHGGDGIFDDLPEAAAVNDGAQAQQGIL